MVESASNAAGAPLIGHSSPTGAAKNSSLGAGQADKNAGSAAADEFLALMEMSTEEFYFALKLKQRGMTEEELQALPADEREKILEEIHAEIREEIKSKVEAGTVGNAAGKKRERV